MKDFDTWNRLKKKIDERINVPFSNKREIWWCSLGLNIGTEQDGKNELFERPVLILRVLNNQTVRVVPLTSNLKEGTYRVSVFYRGKYGVVNVSQVKTISTRRLSRKLARISKVQFEEVMQRLKDTL